MLHAYRPQCVRGPTASSALLTEYFMLTLRGRPSQVCVARDVSGRDEGKVDAYLYVKQRPTSYVERRQDVQPQGPKGPVSQSKWDVSIARDGYG